MIRSPRLSARTLQQLDEMEERPLLSVVSLWEFSLLVQAGRVELVPSPQEWLRIALQAVRLAQITREVAFQLLEVPSTFQRDPADRIIVATARALNVPVLTSDRTILRSGLVRSWKEK